MSKSIRVAIVEDNAKLRRQLESLIAGAPGFECAGTFPDAESALSRLPGIAPDVVLMDISFRRCPASNASRGSPTQRPM